jgi:hypothetical protein
VFGAAVMNVPSVLQLLYLVSAALRENWKLFKKLLQGLCPPGLLVDEEIDVPLTTRWYTIISVARFVLKFMGPLRLLGRKMYFRLRSTKSVARKMWKMIDIWLANGILVAHVCILVDFGDTFYSPEMAFAEESQFKCAYMPRRWLKRMQLLDDMADDCDAFFNKTRAQMDSLDEQLQTRISADRLQFLNKFKNYMQPFADTWLSFPYIACGLGDEEVAKEVAKGILLARGIDKPSYRRGTALVAKLTLSSLSTSKHALFQEPLFSALKAAVIKSITDPECHHVREWVISYLCFFHN